MTDDDVFSLYKRGLWPGPGETLEHYRKRASLLPKQLFWDISAEKKASIEKRMQLLFHTSLPSVELFFSNNGLMPWEGGALFYHEEEGSSSSFIQLRKAFKKGFFLLYSLEEVLSHELLHAMRLEYDCPKYEEILAYKTSSQGFRRLLSPIFQSPLDAYVFLLSFALGTICQLWFSYFSLLIPLAAFSFFSLRLFYRHHTFNKTMRNVTSLLHDPSRALALVARLTDREIDAFASKRPSSILEYLIQHQNKELRLSFLCQDFLQI